MIKLTDLLDENENPCWKGYKQVGMKQKDGREVPNCVPESVNEAPIHFNKQFRKATSDLVKNKTVKNPETKKDVKLTTALNDKDHPAHNQAKSLFQRIKDKVMGKSVNEASPTIKNKISKKDWSKIAKFNKHIGQDGTHYIMKYDDKIGTYLQAVIVEQNDGVYFKSYTSAIEAARAAALKRGFEVDDDEMFTKVGVGSKKPSIGKTTRVSLALTKAGKPQRKMLHIQVYGMNNGYELNSYIN